MAEPVSPDILVYVCHNCIPQNSRLPRQQTRDGVHVLVREIPCSGKIDAQYMFHALEAGVRGIVVIACPKGECHLGQGNYRSEIRIGTVRRLLVEIGLEPERAVLLHSDPDDPPEKLAELVDDVVRRLAALGRSPLSEKNASKGERQEFEVPTQA